MDDRILVHIENGVGQIQLNQPHVLNALDDQTYHDLSAVVSQFNKDKDVRVVIFSGAGRAFCAGDNITDGSLIKKRTFLQVYEYIRHMQNVFDQIEQMDKPTIAAIHGACCGGGLELALSCDIRIAAEDSRIGLPELKLGAIPCIGGTQRLPRLIGTAKTKELLFTSELISAAEAARLGIVNRVVKTGCECVEALSMADRIKQHSALALKMAKRSVDEGRNYPLSIGLEIEARNDAMLFDTHDFYEGMVAFQEKRAAEFWDE